jgi:MYXO-CTERM domain-containing protein
VNPGCEDPWGGPPITWTFKDGTQDPPGFDQSTTSHMPKCDGDTLCSGSGSHVHLGLQLIKDNQIEYHMAGMLPQAQYPTSLATRYLNILLTEGRYDGYSTDAQVQAELEAMHSSDIITYVIGIGDGADAPEAVAQLEKMADWGSGGALDYFDANNQAELEAVLAGIFDNLQLDPCCALRDCSFAPEPTTFEPDPVPDWTVGGDGDGDGDDEPTGDGDGESSSGDGDGDGDGGDGDGGDGDGEDDGPVGEDEIDDTGESGTDPSAVLNDRGCSCRTADDNFGGNLLGTGLLLGLLGFVRRRARAGEIGQ